MLQSLPLPFPFRENATMAEPDLERGTVVKDAHVVEYVISDEDSMKPGNIQSLTLPVVAPPESQVTVGSEQATKEKKKLDFREDARIWQLYLEEAEEKAKFKTDLWNTTLDSLLIFAGLFAGVIASFVIDVRRDLQSDSEPRLLTGILDVMRGRPIGDIFTIPDTAHWVSGLWVVSLFATIFSAIMGVLAKAWLTKYTPAAQTRREAGDAYHRYQLDWQSERWRLKEVLILVPLLVQIAAVLFLAGLVVQLLGDSASIGWILLSFCFVGSIVYCFMTISPVIDSTAPFNTPVSELWHAFFGPKPEDRRTYHTDINKGLGDILYARLIMSPKADYVEEAIAEIALQYWDEKWTDFLSTGDTPDIILARFQHCARSKAIGPVQRDERLCNHLLALSTFVELYERKLRTHSNNSEATIQTIQRYRKLDEALRRSLEPGNPLHRWNGVPEALRPLHFALRTHTLLLSRPPHDLSACGKTPHDFNDNELQDRPWEMSLQEIRSSHRVHFMIAACRGLIDGKPHLKTISLFSLSLSLAKAAFTASETGQVSEWASGLSDSGETEKVHALASRYLARLYQATGTLKAHVLESPPVLNVVKVDGWDTKLGEDPMAADVALVGPLREEDSDTALLRARELRSLIFNLWLRNHALGIYAIKILKHASSADCPEQFCKLITESIERLARLAVFEERDGQGGGLQLLTELSKRDNEIASAVRNALVKQVCSAFTEFEDESGIAAAKFIGKLSSQGNEGPFAKVIDGTLPKLVDIALKQSSSERIRFSVVQRLQGLSKKGFADIKGPVFCHLNTILGSRDVGQRHAFLEALQQLAVLVEGNEIGQRRSLFPLVVLWHDPGEFMQEAAKVLFATLVEIGIHDTDATIASAAQNVLASLAQNDRFADLPLDPLKWLEPATSRGSSPWAARLNAVRVVGMFAQRIKLTHELLKMVLHLALEDSDEDVRIASLQLASDLVCESGAVESYAAKSRDTIISDLSEEIISNETRGPVKDRWVVFLITIAKHVSFPEAIRFLMRRAMAVGFESETLKTIMGFLTCEQFAEDAAAREALRKCIPKGLTADLQRPNRARNVETMLRWTKILVELLSIESLRTIATEALFPVKDAVKDLLNDAIAEANHGDTKGTSKCPYLADLTVATPLRRLLGRSGWKDRTGWADTLVTLSANFANQFLKAPTILLAISLQDPDGDVRQQTLESLRSLANTDATKRALLEGVLRDMNQFAKHTDWNTRLAFVKLLAVYLQTMEITMSEPTSAAGFGTNLLNSKEERYPEASRLALQQFENGVKDGHWKPRQTWVRFIAPQLTADNPSLVMDVFHLATDIGQDPRVRDTALEVLRQLVKSEAQELRGSMASLLWKPVASTLKKSNPANSMTSVLAKLTQPTFEDGEEKVVGGVAGHQMWTQIIFLLDHNGYEGLSKLIEWALAEVSIASFNDLGTLFKQVKLADPVDAALPRYIERSLRKDASTANIRSATVKLLSRLTGVAKDGADYDDVLGDGNDSQIISRLADIAVMDANPELRKDTLDLLKSLFLLGSTKDRFSDLIKTTLSKAVDACFKDPELTEYRPNAIAVIYSLTEPNFNDDCDQLKDIVSLSLSHLLNLTLLATDKDQENMRKQSEDLLLENLTAHTTETKLNRDLLSAIPRMIPTITFEGRRIAVQLARGLEISDKTLTNLTSALAPLLRTTMSSFARETALEFLFKLYSADRLSQLKPHLIEFAIPDIITLAFDDRDDVGGIRTTAIQILVALLTAAMRTDNSAPYTITPVVARITSLATKFMDLLPNDTLRPSVVSLLSLMATETTGTIASSALVRDPLTFKPVRQTISMQIIASVLGTDNVALLGHTELLARLILDGRFRSEPTDNVMLLLASVIVTKPKTASYRFEILTALWCRYRDNPKNSASEGAGGAPMKQEDDLVQWFTLALFGRHATVSEVRTWLKNCSEWLPNPKPASTGTVGQDGELAVKKTPVEPEEARSSSLVQDAGHAPDTEQETIHHADKHTLENFEKGPLSWAIPLACPASRYLTYSPVSHDMEEYWCVHPGEFEATTGWGCDELEELDVWIGLIEQTSLIEWFARLTSLRTLKLHWEFHSEGLKNDLWKAMTVELGKDTILPNLETLVVEDTRMEMGCTDAIIDMVSSRWDCGATSPLKKCMITVRTYEEDHPYYDEDCDTDEWDYPEGVDTTLEEWREEGFTRLKRLGRVILWRTGDVHSGQWGDFTSTGWASLKSLSFGYDIGPSSPAASPDQLNRTKPCWSDMDIRGNATRNTRVRLLPSSCPRINGVGWAGATNCTQCTQCEADSSTDVNVGMEEDNTQARSDKLKLAEQVLRALLAYGNPLPRRTQGEHGGSP
ncbi:hypothetical protein NMY22_g982 [Coprinellus aureogranulatus]|nr:hypothetical protein NMY22_g982 [Coprinellus aureogranulatus]